MSTRGFEAGLNLVPISTQELRVDVPHDLSSTTCSTSTSCRCRRSPFAGSFGSSYGRNRIALGTRPTYIWGNVPFSCVNTTVAGQGRRRHWLRWVGLPPHQAGADAGRRQHGSRFDHRRRQPAVGRRRSSTPFASSALTITALRRLARRRLHGGHDEEPVRRGRQLARLRRRLAGCRHGARRRFATAPGAPATSPPTSTTASFVKLRELNLSYQAP